MIARPSGSTDDTGKLLIDLTRDDGEAGPRGEVKDKPSDDHTNLCHKKNDVDEDDYKFYFNSV
jgi:hypothetical protein